MSFEQKCIKFIKKSERLKNRPYKDILGRKIIGYGHLIKPFEEFDYLGEKGAERLLLQEINLVNNLLDSINLNLNENQKISLISFILSIEIPVFKNSQIFKLLKRNDLRNIGKLMKGWIFIKTFNGMFEIEDLKKRRNREALMFYKKSD